MKVINLQFWKQKKGIAPVGEWSAIDRYTDRVYETGLMYDHETHWGTEPTRKEGK